MLFEEYNVETALKVKEDETREYERTSIALKLLRKGLTVEDVAETTGLPPSQILKLIDAPVKT